MKKSLIFVYFLMTLKLLSQNYINNELIDKINKTVFEIVVQKIEEKQIKYEEDLPVSLIPYAERTDKYYSIGTCFAIGNNQYLSCAHVFNFQNETQYNDFFIRDKEGKVYEIDQIFKYSSNKDFIIFSVKNKEMKDFLELDLNFEINSKILSVGNALGEGIVIREGIFTSKTKEEVNGEWEWLRFSAAASPGNSGGPLLNLYGKVIGVIARKSQNENLNYAIPASLILNFKENKSEIIENITFTFPNNSKKKLTKRNYQTALPKNYKILNKELIADYKNFYDKLSLDYFSENQSKLFPYSEKSLPLLYEEYDYYFPLIASEKTDQTWTYLKPADIKTANIDSGTKLYFGDIYGYSILKVDKANDMNSTDLFYKPEILLDEILKGYAIYRKIANTQTRIVSLYKPEVTKEYKDEYNRIWKISEWPLSYGDQILFIFSTPVPDGMVTIMRIVPTWSKYALTEDLKDLLRYMIFPYSGTLSEWKSLLSQKALIPDFLKDFKIKNSNELLFFENDKFQVNIDKTIQPNSDDSIITCFTSIFKEKDKIVYDIKSMIFIENKDKSNSIYIQKNINPKDLSDDKTRSIWNKIINNKYPYDDFNITYNNSNFIYKTRILSDNQIKNEKDLNFAYVLCLTKNEPVDNYIFFNQLKTINDKLIFKEDEVISSENNHIKSSKVNRAEIPEINKLNEKDLKFCIAMNGLLIKQNDESFITLERYPDKEKSLGIKDEKTYLKDNWGITDKKTYNDEIIWLKNEGHSKNIFLLKKYIDRYGKDNKEILKVGSQKRIDFVVKYNNYIDDDILLIAWDYIRLINVSRSAYQAEFISKEEAVENILWAAKQLLYKFSSWEDLEANYILGKLYWKADDKDFDETMKLSAHLYYKLLDPKKGEWRYFKWAGEVKNNSLYDFLEKYKKDALFFNAIDNEDITYLDNLSNEVDQYAITNYSGWPPIIVASYNKSFKMIEYLLKNGHDVNSINKFNGDTALMIAIRYQKIDIIDLLLNNNVSLVTKNNNNKTVLMYALQYNQNELVKKICEYNDQINYKDKYNWTPLIYAADYSDESIIDLLINKGSDLNSKSNEGWTALMISIRYNKPDNAKYLIKKGADINIKNNEGWTALLLALRYDKYDNARILIEKGADLNAVTNNNFTSLILACEYQPDIAKMILDKGADIKISTKTNYTPLMASCEFNNIEIAKLLLSKGININAIDNYNWTALMYAAKAGNTNVVKYLLENSADKKNLNNKNESALDIAKRYNKTEIIKLLEN